MWDPVTVKLSLDDEVLIQGRVWTVCGIARDGTACTFLFRRKGLFGLTITLNLRVDL